MNEDKPEIERLRIALAEIEALNRSSLWEGDPKGALIRAQIIARKALGIDMHDPSRDPRTIRTPEGYVNNCWLRHGHPEADCQICMGDCPDRDRLNPTPSTYVRGCNLRFGSPEVDCKQCSGECPDRERLMRESPDHIGKTNPDSGGFSETVIRWRARRSPRRRD